MKNFVFTSIATILLVSAAVSYFLEREKEEPDNYIYYIPPSVQNEVESNEVVPDTIKGIKTSDVVRWYPETKTIQEDTVYVLGPDGEPHMIVYESLLDDDDDGFHGRLYVKDDYWLGVDLEGEGDSDYTKALKPFQKYGGLIFNGSMSLEFDPDYFGGCDWQITLSVYPSLIKKFGTIELPWGSITIRDTTEAFIQFGSYANSDPNLFDRYYKLNEGKYDYFLRDFLEQISRPHENSFGISYVISIVRNTDKKIASISGEF